MAVLNSSGRRSSDCDITPTTGDAKPGFGKGDFLFLGLTKVPLGEYFLFFLGFLSKSKESGALLRSLADATKRGFEVCGLAGLAVVFRF